MSLHHRVNLNVWVELALALSLANLYIFLHQGVVHHHLFQDKVGNLRMMMLMIESLLEEVLLVERTRE